MIPYEPWNQNIVLSNTGSMATEHGYYIQFMAPSTGTYTNARMLLGGQPGVPGGAPINFGMAIYDNSSTLLPTFQFSGQDNHGAPSEKLGQGNIAGNPGDYNAFVDVIFDASINLVANQLYWFAFGWEAPGGGPYNFFPIHEDYNVDYNSVLHFNSTNAFPSGVFQQTITSTDLNRFAASENACWFRLYNDNVTFAAGPPGVAGPAGALGDQGLDSANSIQLRFSRTNGWPPALKQWRGYH